MMIRSCQQLRKTGYAAVVAALIVLGAGSSVWALSQRPMTTDEVIDSSEQIFVAVCEGKHSEFRDGNIFTNYKLRPKEIWRGKLATNGDGILEFEELGGSAQGQILTNQIPGVPSTAPPQDIGITQYVGGAANMIVGEEVLLFTRTARIEPEVLRQGLASPVKEGSLIIVGRTYGRYSVLTDPATGEKFVTRMGVEGRGVIPSDASVRGFLNAQQRQLTTQPSATADPTTTTGVPADELLKRLGASDDAKSAAIQRARARSANAVGALTGEIKDFDSLSKVKERVEKRSEANAAK